MIDDIGQPMQPGQPVIQLDHVTSQLGDTLALDDVSLRLDTARIAVIGSNGSGKSTFARLIGGLTRPSTGGVRVHGVDAAKDATALRRLVSIVFSNPDAQIVMPTVAEDVAFSLRGTKLSKPEIAAQVATALDDFRLTELADRSAHELSGGQKQLLALCGALIRRPALLIADEPTAYLDARNSRAVAEHLLRPQGGHQLVLVTHDLELAARCDTAVLFDGGRVVAQGEPTEVIDAYRASLRW
ncbi:MAG TPA: energy-coupling factor ABC transporter ATP-binding protein [Plantibacter sp.]|uniref:energy-coupling factor ABC transporter ATP-binding protein n=1 Tax=unclassified Plantibacter TaxID=2624265 RepID=UPI002D0D8310|nr:energy-coupling factor ABC transporter ATP-binding protein [Plantibacter sp.]